MNVADGSNSMGPRAGLKLLGWPAGCWLPLVGW